MPITRAELMQRLAELAIVTETVEHAAVFTVAESNGLERDIPGGHTKNLFLDDRKGRLFLIIAEHHAPIKLNALHKRLGSARLSFGNAEKLLEVLGVTPGSVTAFAVINDATNAVEVVIDEHLLRHQRINCHPLENTATTGIARDDLLRFIRASGHEPRIMNIRIEATEDASPVPTE